MNSCQHCANARPERGGQAVLYPDALDVCPDCGGPLIAVASGTDPILARRLAIVVGVLAICLGARWIPVPTIPVGLQLSDGSPVLKSIMALGVKPLVTGYMLVEFAALLVPGWRSLRVGAPAGRAKLTRAALFAGIILTLVQAVVLNAAWQALDGVPRDGGAVRVITLMGATFLLLGLARVVDREGLGNGFVIVLLASISAEAAASFETLFRAAGEGLVSGAAVKTGLFATAASGAALVWMYRSDRLPTVNREASADHLLLGRPACGLVPISLTASLLVMGAAISAAWSRVMARGASSDHPVAAHPATAVFLSLLAAVALAYLFNRPTRVADTWGRLSPNPPEGLPAMKPVVLECLVFIGILSGLGAWATWQLGPGLTPYIPGILLGIGIAYDVAEEWRFRRRNPTAVSVWEIHQVYAVAPTVRMIAVEGIPVFAKGARFRALMQFFGPYAPVQIMVPAERASQARALFESRWFGQTAESGTPARAGGVS